MPVEQVVALGQRTLLEVFRLGGPILGVAVAVSLLINIAQVLTSLQDTTISTVPRLLASATAAYLMMPWMWRQMAHFTIELFTSLGNYHP
jgi:flagellar biosynthesis protein FliQ